MLKICDKNGTYKVHIESSDLIASIMEGLLPEYGEWVESPFDSRKSIIQITTTITFHMKLYGNKIGRVFLTKGDYLLPNEKE